MVLAERAQLRLLGAFGLTGPAGVAVAINAPRAQSLLAYLALHRDAPQPRRHLAFLVWPDSSEAQARNSLRQLLHQLRIAWPDADRFLMVDASTLALSAGVELDVDAYVRALATATTADERVDQTGLKAALEQAAAIYGGELLPGSYDDWVTPLRDGLAARQGRALDRLIGLLEQQGDYRAAIEYGRQRLRVDPLHERTYRWLMRLHALNQDRAGALRVYQACASVLERELGVEPEPATLLVHEQVLGLEPGATEAIDEVGPGRARGTRVPAVANDGEPRHRGRAAHRQAGRMVRSPGRLGAGHGR